MTEIFVVALLAAATGIGCAWIYGGFRPPAWHRAFGPSRRADGISVAVRAAKRAGEVEQKGLTPLRDEPVPGN